MRSPTIPAVYALHLADLVEHRFAVPAHTLLKEIGVQRRTLDASGARLTFQQYAQLIARAQALSGEPALPIYYGMQMRISAHGYLGFAAMTAQTLGEAIELGVRFAPTRTVAFSLRLVIDEDDDEAQLILEEHADFGAARGGLLIALIVGLWKTGKDLTGRELHGRAEIATKEPAYFKRFAGIFPGRFRFNARETKLVFDRTLLDVPLIQADKEAQSLAQAQCERELDELFANDDVARTRLALRKDNGFRSESEVAARLGISARTLKRRLAEHGTSFSALLEEARSQRAMALLSHAHMGVEQVAAALGYSDAANFSRAFKRWTGDTPARFRNRAAD